MTEDSRKDIVIAYLKQLHLNRMARDCEAASREAEQRGLGYLGYLQFLLEGELAHRDEQRLRQRLKAAAFPYQKRLEDFDFSLVPCVSKVRLLELAQGAFLTNKDNVLFIGPSGIGKTHLLMGLGRSLCLAGYRVLFRPAVTLAYERASIAITSNLAFAQWTQVFGNEQMTAALLDRLVHRSHILMMEGESFRFRQSLQKQDPQS